jgi:aminopeptidase N
MTRHSIGHYSQMWYPYPWPSAINVNGIVGGMEYPGIVFCRARTDERALFGVTDHEFGHQWFPFIVNTDERRHAWMDEGFNSFINIYSNREWWNDDQAFRGNRSPSGIGQSMSQPNQQPIVTRPDFIYGRNLGYLAYGKPAVGLYLLREEILGPDLFDRAFKAYINRWAFKSPQPSDFFRTMEEVSGTDLGWFWLGWFYGTGTLDQGVSKVEQETAADGTPGWVRTTLTTSGGVVMPVEFEVTYTDDTTERRRLPAEVWATTDAWMAGWEPQGRRVRTVVIDPDESFPDINRANNRWGR